MGKANRKSTGFVAILAQAGSLFDFFPTHPTPQQVPVERSALRSVRTADSTRGVSFFPLMWVTGITFPSTYWRVSHMFFTINLVKGI